MRLAFVGSLPEMAAKFADGADIVAVEHTEGGRRDHLLYVYGRDDATMEQFGILLRDANPRLDNAEAYEGRACRVIRRSAASLYIAVTTNFPVKGLVFDVEWPTAMF